MLWQALSSSSMVGAEHGPVGSACCRRGQGDAKIALFTPVLGRRRCGCCRVEEAFRLLHCSDAVVVVVWFCRLCSCVVNAAEKPCLHVKESARFGAPPWCLLNIQVGSWSSTEGAPGIAVCLLMTASPVLGSTQEPPCSVLRCLGGCSSPVNNLQEK